MTKKSKIKDTITTIGLDFGVAGQTSDASELIDRASSLPENLNIGYAYYVISWDDVDNKYDIYQTLIAAETIVGFEKVILFKDLNIGL